MKLKTWLLAGASVLASTAHAYALAGLGSLVISTLLTVGLGSLLPAASAAAIGLATLSLGASVASFAFNFLGRPKAANPEALKQTTRGQEGPGRYATGRVLLTAKIGFGNTSGYNIHRLLLHCFGEMDGAEEYFYDGRSITVEADGQVSSPPFAKPGGSNLYIRTKVGDGTETSFPQLQADFPTKWTADHRVRGITQSLLTFVNPGTGDDRFAKLLTGGVKEASILSRQGKFYDPRDASTRWTLNGPLQIAHWWARLPGWQASMLDLSDIGDRADDADVSVTTLTGTAPRSQLSGGWEGPLTTDIVLDMLESAGMEVVPSAEKFTLRWLEDNPASELTYYDRHIIDRVFQSGPEGAKRPNICKLHYFSPERRYEMAEIDLTNAPWAKVQGEIDKYGEQEFPVKLPFCCDASQAQRIARRLFWMARADFGTIKTTFAGIAAWGKRTITIEVPDVGSGYGSVFVKCRKGPVRVNDEEGTCEIPVTIIPAELQTPWNAATMEVPAPPVLEAFEYESTLDKPAAPSIGAVVQLSDLSYQTRSKFTGVTGGVTAEASYRTYSGGLPNLPLGMTEYQGITANTWFAWVAGDARSKADFRVRFFDVDDEASYFSDWHSEDPLAVDNTAPSAPQVTVTPTGSPTNGADIDAYFTDLHAVKLVIEHNYDGGGWTGTTYDNEIPEVLRSISIGPFINGSSPPLTKAVQIRVTAYTSDGTAGTQFTDSVDIPSTGGP